MQSEKRYLSLLRSLAAGDTVVVNDKPCEILEVDRFKRSVTVKKQGSTEKSIVHASAIAEDVAPFGE